jgi:hypothetical protein
MGHPFEYAAHGDSFHDNLLEGSLTQPRDSVMRSMEATRALPWPRSRKLTNQLVSRLGDDAIAK